LAIRLGAACLALRLTEIGGLFADKTVTPVPGGAAALVGLAGFRSVILPVYSLHVLLGHPEPKALRWRVATGTPATGLGSEQYEGHLRVASDSLFKREGDGEFVHTENAIRPVISIPSILDAIRK